MARTLSEAESKAVLSPFGIPFLPEANVANSDEALLVGAKLGYPLVAKLCGDNIAHKTERGLVRLMIQTGPELQGVVADLLEKATADDGEVSVLIAPMVRATRELIAGITVDDQFGPTVVLGIGGIFTEVIADIAIRLVPISEIDAEEMIAELRTQSFLGAFRGEPEVDRRALVRILMALSEFATSSPNLIAVDLNPLMIVGGSPVAVDALVELGDDPVSNAQ
jgi:succinyl-CoA synthetase beta subunit